VVERNVGLTAILARSNLGHQPEVVVATAACSIWGTSAGYPHLWLPYTGLAASLLAVPTRSWVASSRTGSWVMLSALLKSSLGTIGLYALLAELACIPLVLYWEGVALFGSSTVKVAWEGCKTRFTPSRGW